MATTTISAAGAIAVLAWVAPTLDAFFAWQFAASLLHLAVIRLSAWRLLGSRQRERFSAATLRRVWRASAGMSAVAISGAVLAQLDKLVLSAALSLEAFGHYALASVLSGGLYLVLTPLYNVIFPRMTVLLGRKSESELTQFYRTGTRLLASLLFPLTLATAVCSQDLLLLWTRDASIAVQAAPVLQLLLLGTALNGAMHFPHALQIAAGMSRIPLAINAVLIAITVPITMALAREYGAIGGAASWAIMNILYLFLGTFLTHQVLLRGLAPKWLLADVLPPILIAAAIVGPSAYVTKAFGLSVAMNVLIPFGFALVAVAVLLSTFSNPRTALRTIGGANVARTT